MKKTPDSIEIDTTSMTLDEQCEFIVNLVREKEQNDG